MRKPELIIVGWIGVAAVAAGVSHNVPAKLTATDEAKTLSFVERRIEASPVRSFSDEVRLYGLYSRHGQFYPPYTPIPDVSWSELTHNI